MDLRMGRVIKHRQRSNWLTMKEGRCPRRAPACGLGKRLLQKSTVRRNQQGVAAHHRSHEADLSALRSCLQCTSVHLVFEKK